MHSFLDKIDAFIAAHDMPEWKFGAEALGDHKFVKQVRNGRSPSLKIAAKVEAFMLAYPNHERADA